jgi:hypothetical protein
MQKSGNKSAKSARNNQCMYHQLSYPVMRLFWGAFLTSWNMWKKSALLLHPGKNELILFLGIVILIWNHGFA